MTVEQRLADLTVPAPDRLTGDVLVGVGLADEYVERDSTVGRLFVAFNGLGVSTVSLDDDARAFEVSFSDRLGRPIRPAEDLPRPIAAHLDRALHDGRPGRLPLDLRGLSPFQAEVLEATASIPRGEVRPYGWVAKEIGRPAAVRAVGTALASNPIPLILPCHRVVRSDGTFGQYSLGTNENKPRLLAEEGLDIAEFQQLAGRGVRLVASTTTRIFCHPTCRAARRIRPDNRHELDSTSQATTSGYRPCLLCRPVG